jgi:hypothetical protein
VLVGLAVRRALPVPADRVRAAVVAGVLAAAGATALALLAGGRLAAGPYDPVRFPAELVAPATLLWIGGPAAVVALLRRPEEVAAEARSGADGGRAGATAGGRGEEEQVDDVESDEVRDVAGEDEADPPASAAGDGPVVDEPPTDGPVTDDPDAERAGADDADPGEGPVGGASVGEGVVGEGSADGSGPAEEATAPPTDRARPATPLPAAGRDRPRAAPARSGTGGGRSRRFGRLGHAGRTSTPAPPRRPPRTVAELVAERERAAAERAAEQAGRAADGE